MNDPQMQAASSNGGAAPTQAGSDLKSSLRGVAGQAAEQGHERIDATRDATATTLEKLAEGVRGAASELERDGTVGNLSSYIVQMSESMTRVASGLREKSGDDLVHEVARIARENPTVFVAGAVALGFGLTRFARASTHRDATQAAAGPSEDAGSDLAGTPTGSASTVTGASSPSAGTSGRRDAREGEGPGGADASHAGAVHGGAGGARTGATPSSGISAATPGASSLGAGGGTTPGMSAGPGASLGIGAGDSDRNGGSSP